MIRKILLLLLLSISTAQAENLRKVDFVRVVDGDTIEVRYTTSIRLNDVDCYENKKNTRQKWQAEENNLTEEEIIAKGKENEQKLKDLLANNEDDLYLQVKGLDKYKRILGKMYIGKGNEKIDINDYMLKDGGCLPYKPRPHTKREGK